METPRGAMRGLRLACAAVAVAGAALVVTQKHLLASPGPALALVIACVLPFGVDARWPALLRPDSSSRPDRLLGPDWPLVLTLLVVTAGAGWLLAYRPAEGDAAVLFFVAIAASVGGTARPSVSAPAGLLVAATPAVAGLIAGSQTPPTAAVGIAFAWVAGAAVQSQTRTAAELMKARTAATELQITAERQQLAREFHDLVAHTLSVTMLHMTAVRMSLEDGDPRDALESLDQAEHAGREAMREMRQTVRLLGSTQVAGQSAPLPHVRDLPDLVAGYAQAGLNVQLAADCDLTGVSGDAGLAAYRIAQESLANVAKHAPGSAARVEVRASAAELRLTVTNEVPAPATGRAAGRTPGPGHGVSGMTQRAALVGGTFSAGPCHGQWRTEAVLPMGDRR